jgi:hypothetical protein
MKSKAVAAPPVVKKLSRPEIMVIGNSHTMAVAMAQTPETKRRIKVINLASYFDPVNRRNKVLPPNIVDMFQPKRIFCSFGGSEHSVFGLLEAPVRFDFMTPQQSAVEPGRSVINYALVRATLERAMRNAMNHTRELRGLYACPITHVCTPPPFRALVEGRRLPALFEANLHLGISPASIRKKLYDMHSDIARANAAALGIGFLEVPEGCTDADGFLLDEFCNREPTHANTRYGKLVIDQMLGT